MEWHMKLLRTFKLVLIIFSIITVYHLALATKDFLVHWQIEQQEILAKQSGKTLIKVLVIGDCAVMPLSQRLELLLPSLFPKHFFSIYKKSFNDNFLYRFENQFEDLLESIKPDIVLSFHDYERDNNYLMKKEKLEAKNFIGQKLLEIRLFLFFRIFLYGLQEKWDNLIASVEGLFVEKTADFIDQRQRSTVILGSTPLKDLAKDYILPSEYYVAFMAEKAIRRNIKMIIIQPPLWKKEFITPYLKNLSSVEILDAWVVNNNKEDTYYLITNKLRLIFLQMLKHYD
ncbi:MAG: hypothetical protein HQK51_12785 [Oligoflexia bacterium]|nr:hypothetical protein [Oligoflexia bacterium]